MTKIMTLGEFLNKLTEVYNEQTAKQPIVFHYPDAKHDCTATTQEVDVFQEEDHVEIWLE